MESTTGIEVYEVLQTTEVESVSVGMKSGLAAMCPNNHGSQKDLKSKC
jgi:hypothetical protein